VVSSFLSGEDFPELWLSGKIGCRMTPYQSRRLAAIIHRVACKVVDKVVIQGKVRILNRKLEVVIGFLELVIDEEV